MISRQWRELAKPACAEGYLEHLRTETFPELSKLAGFVSASILRRHLAEGMEFLIVTHWRSMDAIRQFAGDDRDAAVVPEAVQAMMLDCDRRVRHYEVVEWVSRLARQGKGLPAGRCSQMRKLVSSSSNCER